MSNIIIVIFTVFFVLTIERILRINGEHTLTFKNDLLIFNTYTKFY